MRSFQQHVSFGVFSFLRHCIPSGLSVFAAWKTHHCHRKYTTHEPRHNFDERLHGFEDQHTSWTWGKTDTCLHEYGRRLLIPSSALTILHPCERCRLTLYLGFSTCSSSTGVKRKSWTGRSRFRHCPTSHSDARSMRRVGIEHGLRFCTYH